MRWQYSAHLSHYATGQVTVTAEQGSALAAIMGTTQVEPFAPAPHWTEGPFFVERTAEVARA